MCQDEALRLVNEATFGTEVLELVYELQEHCAKVNEDGIPFDEAILDLDYLDLVKQFEN